MRRPFAYIGLTFYTFLAALNFIYQPLFLGIFCAAAFLLAIISLVVWKTRRLKHFIGVFFVCVSLLAAGLLYAGWMKWRFSPDAELSGHTLLIEGQIDGGITEKDGYLQFYIKPQKALDTLTDEDVKIFGRFFVTTSDTNRIRPFDIISAEIKLSPFENNDLMRYYRSKGVYVKASISGEPEVLNKKRFTVKSLFYTARSAVGNAVDSRIDPPAGSLVKGIVLGDKETLPYKITDDFRRSGLSHTMAVSGLHITIFTGTLMLLLNAVGTNKRLVYAICALLPFLIAGMAGFSMSALRAALMGGVYFTGKLIDRNADGLNSLGFALLVITFFSPFSAADTGLILSASATLSLILFSDKAARLIKRMMPLRWEKIPFVKTAMSALCCSFSAMLFTLPITVLFFGAFSAASMAANIFAGPLVYLTFISGVLTAVFYPIFPLSFLFAAAAELCAGAVIAIASAFSDTPFSYIYADRPHVFLSIIFLVFTAALTFVKYRKKWLVRPVIAISLIVIVFCSGISGSILAGRERLELIAVDVGNGDCMTAIKNRSAVVVDCGGVSGASDRLLTVLRSRNVNNVSAVIVSHTHRDHAEGIDDILYAFPVDAVFMPPALVTDRYRADIETAAEKTGAKIIQVDDDMTVKLMDGIVIRLYIDHLKKVGLSSKDENANCLIAGLSYRFFDCLFTGDIGFREENLLAEYGGLLDVEVLKVAHHGSKNSTGESFLKQVTPLTAIICTGKNNYGHPAGQTLERLAAAEGSILRTDQSGNISIKTDGRRHYSLSTQRVTP